MSLMKYSEVLAMAKDKMKEVMAPLRATEMRKKAELKICEIDNEIATMQQRINELCAEYPLNFESLVDALDDMDLNARRKTQLERIISEMFSESKAK